MRKRMWALLLALSLCIASVPMGNVHAAEKTRTTRCNLILRSKASASSKSLDTIPGGTEISVLGTSGSWTKTTYNGHTGYVATKYLMDITRSGYYPLREGDNNPHVKTMQEQLARLGYFNGTADGDYDKATADAVKAFQKQNGLSADGVAGGETQTVLFGDAAKGGSTSTEGGATATPGTSTVKVSEKALRSGSKGEDVKNLQERLIALGYLSDKADGIYGSATEKAVRQFQKSSGLSVDGKAGKITQTLLYSSSAKKADGSVIGSAAGADPAASPGKAPELTITTTLKRGMTSDDVRQLQERLKDLGYFNTNATGYFGTVTKESLELFQRYNGLATDGVAGSSTLKKMFSAEAISLSAAQNGTGTGTGGTTETQKYKTLKYGMKSSAVTTMQRKLKELGYMKADATGYFGSQTKEAVISFQKKNDLSSDGIAGTATLNRLYGPLAIASGGGSASTGNGKTSGPSASQVKLLHWNQSVKPSLKNGDTLLVFDPSTSYTWTLRAMSLGRHCDSEPLTAEDTRTMNLAFGNKTTWTPKVVYIKLPSGTWTLATTHNTPHLSGSIKTNNFDGHLCVHFLRDMAEAEKNDPKYGVQNQKVIRDAWKQLTGSTVN